MDIKEYISSGILELYAAGALSDAEAREVEKIAEQHRDVKTELEAITLTYEGYAAAHSKNPRPELRAKVMDRINDEVAASSVKSQTSRNDGYISPTIVPTQQSGIYGKWKYLMAAVVAFLVINILMNVYFMNSLSDSKKEILSLVQQNAEMQKNYNQIKNTMNKKNEEMKFVMNRSNKIVDLKGMPTAPDYSAVVYWNPNTKQVMLMPENLPMPPKDKQYQLWALKDGKPINAGVFNMSGDMVNMEKIQDADAFAITLEPMGGSVNPTMDAMYVVGKI